MIKNYGASVAMNKIKHGNLDWQADPDTGFTDEDNRQWNVIEKKIIRVEEEGTTNNVDGERELETNELASDAFRKINSQRVLHGGQCAAINGIRI